MSYRPAPQNCLICRKYPKFTWWPEFRFRGRRVYNFAKLEYGPGDSELFLLEFPDGKVPIQPNIALPRVRVRECLFKDDSETLSDLVRRVIAARRAA